MDHPAITLVTKRIVSDEIGGAADTAKEVLAAMNQVAQESKANNIDDFDNEIEKAAFSIIKSCSSLAPPINVLHILLRTLEDEIEAGRELPLAKINLNKSINELSVFFDTALDKVALIGSELVKDNATVFMYSMSSSIWKLLRKAKSQGKDFKVLVTEARPANEGLWTVDEMNKSSIPVDVSVDACLGEMIARSDVVFAGVDAIGANGSVLNKTGTYLCALVARENNVPFYCVSDTLKLDSSSLLGLPFKSESIHYNEVMGEKTYSDGVNVIGKVFDVTPPHLITGIITELGIIPPSACVNVMWKMKLSKRINEYLPLWSKGNL